MAGTSKRVNQIFICYRREESTAETGRIYDRLVRKFGKKAIFKDVDSIPPGIDFREYIDSEVGKCEVVLVVIGDQWLNLTDKSGQRRLDDTRDYVRIEIESALQRGIPVIPLWVRHTKALPDDCLPETLHSLAYRQGMPIDHDRNFHLDVNKLIRYLQNEIFAPPADDTEESSRKEGKRKIKRRNSSAKNKSKSSKATKALREVWRHLPVGRGNIKTESDGQLDRAPIDPRLVGPWKWILTIPWILSCLLGAALITEDFPPKVYQNFLEPALWGLTMALVQTLILRYVAPVTSWWILSTVAGAVTAGLTYYAMGYEWEVSWQFLGPYAKELPFIKPAMPIITLLALRWLLVSLFQWLILSRFMRQSWLWPLTTSAAAGAWGLIAVLFSYGKVKGDFLLMNVLCAGLLIGVAQGVCLVYLISSNHRYPQNEVVLD